MPSYYSLFLAHLTVLCGSVGALCSMYLFKDPDTFHPRLLSSRSLGPMLFKRLVEKEQGLCTEKRGITKVLFVPEVEGVHIPCTPTPRTHQPHPAWWRLWGVVQPLTPEEDGEDRYHLALMVSTGHLRHSPQCLAHTESSAYHFFFNPKNTQGATTMLLAILLRDYANQHKLMETHTLRQGAISA